MANKTRILQGRIPKSKNRNKKKTRLIKHKAFLDFIYSTDEDQRKQIIELAKDDQILAICECIYNVVQKNVKLTPKDIKKLRKSGDILYCLCDPDIPVKEKRALLVQKGGLAFLPALLAPILGGLLGAAVSR